MRAIERAVFGIRGGHGAGSPLIRAAQSRGSRFYGRPHRSLYFHHYMGNRLISLQFNLLFNQTLRAVIAFDCEREIDFLRRW